MLHLINEQNGRDFPHLMHSMLRDRKRLFVDTLGWNLPCQGEIERDQFDNANAEYLVLADRDSLEHLASLRLLPTTTPHLMDTCFADLCEEGVPRGRAIREITRLCLPLGRRSADRILARNLLARAIIEYALLEGIQAYTCVVGMAFFSELLSAGWDCRPLGLPKDLQSGPAAALQINITPDTLSLMSPAWRCASAPMRLVASAPATLN